MTSYWRLMTRAYRNYDYIRPHQSNGAENMKRVSLALSTVAEYFLERRATSRCLNGL